jgi:hypothetical protein
MGNAEKGIGESESGKGWDRRQSFEFGIWNAECGKKDGGQKTDGR